MGFSPRTRPWQKGLDNTELLDPLLATSHNPEASQYYTHIPRHGRPRRLDAILVRQQIPNIPRTYYNVIRMPISDHSLVLIGLRWRTGGHTTIGPKPEPNVKRWYALHFKKYKTSMANVAPPDRDPPLPQARRILSAIARAARPEHARHTTTQPQGTTIQTPEEKLKTLGQKQEKHIHRQLGKIRRAVVHRSGYFFKMVKRWRTGLIAQDAPRPPIGGTQHTLNHYAGDHHYDTQYCKELIRKHVRKQKWDTQEPTWSEFQGCLRAPKNKSAGPDGVPHTCSVTCP